MLMQKIIFAFLISIGSLFAGQNDFLGVLQQILEAAAEGQQTSNPQQKATSKSLAEEAADKKVTEQRQEEQKNEYIRQFNEKIVPRLKNLEAFNEQFYQKYLIKDVDTPEIIDEKFKNRLKISREMAKDYQASMQEYEVLRQAANKMCDIDYKNCWAVSKLSFYEYPENIEKQYVLPPHGFQDAIQNNTYLYDEYGAYLREAYQTYDVRKQQAKEAEEREAQYAKEEVERKIRYEKEQKARDIALAKMKKENEARSKMIAAERNRVEPACQRWRAEARKKVYSMGIGDKIVSSNGGVHIIYGVNANTFTIRNPLFDTYFYLQKDTCVPQSALRNAPSPYCYQ